jgi:hypothetical protein
MNTHTVVRNILPFSTIQTRMLFNVGLFGPAVHIFTFVVGILDSIRPDVISSLFLSETDNTRVCNVINPNS